MGKAIAILQAARARRESGKADEAALLDLQRAYPRCEVATICSANCGALRDAEATPDLRRKNAGIPKLAQLGVAGRCPRRGRHALTLWRRYLWACARALHARQCCLPFGSM